ncbi:MAG: sugar kinase [Planctomycetes bacterium]|nr:sugar kinase [Planctomycetota bacterium]
MSKLLVVGSVAIDSIETPHGKAPNVQGGSAVYFSYAASFFNPVRLVGVVGQDFPKAFEDVLAARKIDLRGLERADGKTFRWSGRYEGAMNSAETLSVELNVFGNFEPKIPQAFRDSQFVFLANGGPDTQRHVLEQMRKPRFTLADTMNLWISETRPQLLKLLKLVDGIVLNDGEARMLTGESNLIKAGRAVRQLGPNTVIIKKGEHGSLLVDKDGLFGLPAYPAERVVDPTGAGDSFAGGLMGYLARQGKVTDANLRRAIAYGTVTASFTIEDFSLNRLRQIKLADIQRRFREFRAFVHL